MKLTQHRFLIVLFSGISLAAILHIGQFYDFWNIAAEVLTAFRWIVILLFCWLGFRRRSLTTWILISMIIGVEFGHDFPSIAIHLNLFSKIFLRMVKTIIAPLLFGTLVVGIAGHSNLRQVGRMGWKSILYFEVVSTIALFIGLLAINISKAGVGVTIPAGIAQQNIAEIGRAHV